MRLPVALAIIAYACALLLANQSVAVFGPMVTPLNAFFFIGLDLALRDWLHVRVSFLQMLTLIVSTAILSYMLNPAAGTIALASACAFCAAAVVDWFVFTMIGGSWLRRVNGSNAAGAAVDSLVFPTIAFGMLLPHIVAMQFVAKVAGGAVWAWVIHRVERR